jgi:hypothetical protein
MTDTEAAQNATEASEAVVQPDTPPEPDQATHDDQGAEDDSPNAEAAKWRTRFREAEAAIAERDNVIASYRRAECERTLADLLDVPGDLFDVGGAEVADFYSDSGELNDAELRAAAGALIEERPRLGKPKFTRSWGQVSGVPPAEGPSWSNVINPR